MKIRLNTRAFQVMIFFTGNYVASLTEQFKPFSRSVIPAGCPQNFPTPPPLIDASDIKEIFSMNIQYLSLYFSVLNILTEIDISSY